MSIIASDPIMQGAASAISGMKPADAINYLVSHGLNQALAIGVMEASGLKQAAKNAPGQAPHPQGNVLQQTHQAVQQHSMDQARQGGLADLPVNPDMYSFGEKKGMAAGGIVAFNGEDEQSLVEEEFKNSKYAGPHQMQGLYGTGLEGQSITPDDPLGIAAAEARQRARVGLPPIQPQVAGPIAGANGPTGQPGQATPTAPAVNLANSGQMTNGQARPGATPPPPTPGFDAVSHTRSVMYMGGMGGNDAFEKELEGHIEAAKPKSFQDYVAAERAALGPNTASADYKTQLAKLSGMADSNAKNEMKMAKAGAFFNMAIAAGQPGQAGNGLSKFLNAAAQGGASYSQAVPHIQQGLFAAQQKLAEDKFKVADAERREDSDLIQNARREYGADSRSYAMMVGDLTKVKISENNANMRAMIQERNLTDRSNKYYGTIEAATIRAESAEKINVLKELAVTSATAMTSAQRAVSQASLGDPTQRYAAQQALDEATAKYYAVHRHLAKLAGIDDPEDAKGGSPAPSSGASYDHLWSGK